MARKDAIVTQFRDASIQGIESTENLYLKYGNAEFTGNNEIRVTDQKGNAEVLERKKYLYQYRHKSFHSRYRGFKRYQLPYFHQYFSITRAACSIYLIVGGGYIGLEFAQMFRRFGCRSNFAGKR